MTDTPKTHQPTPWADIWPEWVSEGEIGRGAYGITYRAVKQESGVETHAAIKLITVSAASDGDASFDAAPDEGDREAWLDARVNEIVGEIRTMIELKGAPAVISVEDYKVRRTPGSAAIFIRMELLDSVFGFFNHQSEVSEEDVIRLGCDICDALSVCEERHIIHRDVKPENILVTAYGAFKLGDFGISRRLDTMTHSLSQKGTSVYMAPEVMNGHSYGNSVDTYSLGLVLYQLLNGNRMPFTDPGKQLLTPSDRERAAYRRLSGEALPPPCHASSEMADVILRACAYSPADRFACAADMKKALEAVRKGVYVPAPAKGGDKRGRILRIVVPVLAAAALAVLLLCLLRFCGACGGDGAETDTLPAGEYSGTLLFESETGPAAEPATQPDTEPDSEAPAEDVTDAVTDMSADTARETTGDTSEDTVPDTTPEDPTDTDEATEAPTEPETEHIHAFGEWVTVIEPDCVNTGKEARICVCGTMEENVLPARGHTPQSVPAVPAACSESGLSEGSVCAVCGETLTAQTVLPALGHEYENDYCTRCGLMRTSEGLEYYGTVLVGLGTCTDTDIILPASTTAIGNSVFRGCTTLERIVIPEGVTAIGEAAFAGCTSLGEIVLPESVSAVGKEAFDGCSSAVRLVVGDGVRTIGEYAFRSCTSLGDVTLGKNVESIGKYAFQDCTRMPSVTLPDSMTAVSRGCFWGCTGLETVTFGSRITDLEDACFSGCASLLSLTFPDSVTYIAQAAFRGCTSLQSIHFGKGVDDFDAYAFQNCSSLSSVTMDAGNKTYRCVDNCILRGDEVYFGIGTSVIPTDGSVTKIGEFAFAGCTGLTEMRIPESITVIGRSAFCECTNLAEVVIPAGVTTIGRTAFYQCTSLTAVYIPSGVTGIAAEAFHLCRQLSIQCEAAEQPAGWVSNWNSWNCPVEWGVVRDSQGLAFSSNGDGTCKLTGIGTCTDTRVYVPSVSPDGDTVTSLAAHSLAYIEGMTYVYLPDTVTTLGIGAFMGSQQLTEVRMSRSLTSMGAGLFQECSALERVVVPDGVTAIPVSAFEYCFALSDVTLPQSIVSIDSNAFCKCTSLRKIRLPDGLTSIGDFGFAWCESLETVTLPKTCTSVGLYAFNGCTSLTIRARMESEPSDFHSRWNRSSCPVIWGWTGE